MKPIRHTHFLISIVCVVIIFIALLVWWLSFMLSSFQALNTTESTNPLPFEKVNIDVYNQLYKKDGP